jgi:hypothetical protein
MEDMAQSLALRLREIIQDEFARLRSITKQDSNARTGGGSGWSRKQELGHLIDSATNNRVRFIVAALNGNYRGPTYDGEGWVELGGYADTDWVELVELWTRSNKALVRAIERIPNERLSAQCKVGDADTVTLMFLIEDYILHMQHHLDHIFGREQQTAYPSASLPVAL